MIDQRLDYTHNSPVEAGFVEEAHYWLDSSARIIPKQETVESNCYFYFGHSETLRPVRGPRKYPVL